MSPRRRGPVSLILDDGRYGVLVGPAMIACARVWVALGALASCHRGESPVKTERPPDVKPPAATAKVEPPTPERVLQKPKPEAFPPCPGGGFSFELKGLPQERISERFGSPAERETYRA